MLVEAIEIIRLLWDGDTVDHWGTHHTVENARLFSAPTSPIEIICAASGTAAAELAAEHGDGMWATSPSRDNVEAYRAAGGTGHVIGQLTVCWDADEERARARAYEQWPNAAVAGQLSQDHPTWSHFESAATMVTPAQVAERVVCGGDLDRLLEAIAAFVDAGVTSLHVHQIGDQQDFLDWWSSQVIPAFD